MKVIECTPTPEGMTNLIIGMIEHGDKQYARKQIIKAFRIAYAFWYPDKPEYELPGCKIIKNQSGLSGVNQ